MFASARSMCLQATIRRMCEGRLRGLFFSTPTCLEGNSYLHGRAFTGCICS